MLTLKPFNTSTTEDLHRIHICLFTHVVTFRIYTLLQSWFIGYSHQIPVCSIFIIHNPSSQPELPETWIGGFSQSDKTLLVTFKMSTSHPHARMLLSQDCRCSWRVQTCSHKFMHTFHLHRIWIKSGFLILLLLILTDSGTLYWAVLY